MQRRAREVRLAGREGGRISFWASMGLHIEGAESVKRIGGKEGGAEGGRETSRGRRRPGGSRRQRRSVS